VQKFRDVSEDRTAFVIRVEEEAQKEKRCPFLLVIKILVLKMERTRSSENTAELHDISAKACAHLKNSCYGNFQCAHNSKCGAYGTEERDEEEKGRVKNCVFVFCPVSFSCQVWEAVRL
jgi:hypothetical protein